MIFDLRVRPEARDEIREQARYYQRRVDGLGLRFVRATGRTIEGLGRMPGRHRIDFDDIHVAIARPFPFGVFFIVDETEVVVLAVFDLRRNPETRRQTLRGRQAQQET